MEAEHLTSNDRDITQPKMPVGYSLLAWILTVDVIGCTIFVWWLIFLVLVEDRPIDMFQAPLFFKLVIGYHLLLLFWTIVGNIMQMSWRTLGTSGLFAVVLVIGSMFCNVAAIQLAYLI
jgi:hypothetical protein